MCFRRKPRESQITVLEPKEAVPISVSTKSDDGAPRVSETQQSGHQPCLELVLLTSLPRTTYRLPSSQWIPEDIAIFPGDLLIKAIFTSPGQILGPADSYLSLSLFFQKRGWDPESSRGQI